MATTHKFECNEKRPPCSPGELWKPIPGWFGLQVSNLGRVWAPARIDTIGRSWPAQIRKGTYSPDRGNIISVERAGVIIVTVVARLMLMAFDRPPVEGEVARHLDDNNKRDVLHNLAWGLPQDNSDDMVRNGRSLKGERNCKAKLTPDDVRYIRRVHAKGDRKFGSCALGRRFGVSDVSIDAIVRGRNWGWLDGYNA